MENGKRCTIFVSREGHAEYYDNPEGDWLHDPDHTAVSETELCEALKKVGELQKEADREREMKRASYRECAELEAANRDLKADVNRFKGYILDPGNRSVALIEENWELREIIKDYGKGIDDLLKRFAIPLPSAVKGAVIGAEFGAGLDIDKQVWNGDSAKEPVKPALDSHPAGRRVKEGHFFDRPNTEWSEPARAKESPYSERPVVSDRRKEACRDSGQVGRRTIGSSRRTGEDRRKT